MANQLTIENPWQRWLIRFGVFIAMVILVVPGAWVVLTAFRPNIEVLARPAVWIPQVLTLHNFLGIFGQLDSQQGLPVAQYFINSLVISITSTIVAIVIGMAGGYSFARFSFKGKATLFLAFMLSRTVPGVALSLPLFIIWARLGLIDTSFGMILVYMAVNIPFTIWLTDGFFRQIPVDLSEAAQIDGCTRWQAFWKVEFPLARSGLASAAIFAFLTSWNEYALASQLTRTGYQNSQMGMANAMGYVSIILSIVFTFYFYRKLVAARTFMGGAQ